VTFQFFWPFATDRWPQQPEMERGTLLYFVDDRDDDELLTRPGQAQ
jgi:hypothetical protein